MSTFVPPFRVGAFLLLLFFHSFVLAPGGCLEKSRVIGCGVSWHQGFPGILTDSASPHSSFKNLLKCQCFCFCFLICLKIRRGAIGCLSHLSIWLWILAQSWSQGCEILPCVRFCAGHGACLRFYLFLCPGSYPLLFPTLKIFYCNKKNNKKFPY